MAIVAETKNEIQHLQYLAKVFFVVLICSVFASAKSFPAPSPGGDGILQEGILAVTVTWR